MFELPAGCDPPVQLQTAEIEGACLLSPSLPSHALTFDTRSAAALLETLLAVKEHETVLGGSAYWS